MEIFFSIAAVASLVFCSVMIVDRTIFKKRLADTPLGLTGKEIQERTGFQFEILSVNGNSYAVRVKSKLTIFKCKLVFVNGKLISKQQE